ARAHAAPSLRAESRASRAGGSLGSPRAYSLRPARCGVAVIARATLRRCGRDAAVQTPASRHTHRIATGCLWLERPASSLGGERVAAAVADGLAGEVVLDVEEVLGALHDGEQGGHAGDLL